MLLDINSTIANIFIVIYVEDNKAANNSSETVRNLFWGLYIVLE